MNSKVMVYLAFTFLSVVSALLICNFVSEHTDYHEIQQEKFVLGPGSIAIYSVCSEVDGIPVEGSATYQVLGINGSGHLYKLSYDLRYADGNSFDVSDRYALTNLGHTTTISEGKEGIDTIYGKILAPYVDYESSGTQYRDHYNPYTGILLLSTSESTRVTLSSMNPIWLDAYAPLDSFKESLHYSLTCTTNGETYTGSYTEAVVAEDLNGHVFRAHMITYDGKTQINYSRGSKDYFSEKYLETIMVDTINGERQLVGYEFSSPESTFVYYIDEKDGIPYRITMSNEVSSMVMEYSSIGEGIIES